MERRSHNRLLRFGVLLLTVLLVGALGIAATAAQADDPACYGKGDVNADGIVDNRDAIYTLYHHMNEEAYPIEQNWDFNGDAVTNNKDAIFVLYHFLFPEDSDYAMEGIAHGYYDPAWKWFKQNGTVSAEVTVKCGCTPQPHTLTIDEGVEIRTNIVTEANCTQSGVLRYFATVIYQGELFAATLDEEIPATGHNMDRVRSCTNDAKCATCGYTEKAWGHNWVANPEKDIPATCQEQGASAYQCSICHEEKFVDQEATLSHSLSYYQQTLGEDLALGNCRFVKQYRCEFCGEVFNGTAESDTYTRHTYKAALTQEATCQVAGVKTYTCTECGDHYTEEVPVNPQAHDWDAGVSDGTTITYTCQAQGCTATKTAVDASAAAVAKESLANVSELQLAQGAAMALEEDTLDALNVETDIKVEVSQADLEETNLTEEQKQQVGNNTVYDFNMYIDGQKVTEFDTEITISLPYELGDDDVDSIDIWYLDDVSGEPVRVNGTYSNGFVTFKTKHFSRYTVTRLTPAERCARYGHVTVDSQKDATCTEDGYDMSSCQRCGQIVEKTVIKKLGHDYTHTDTAASCTTSGKRETGCTRCDYSAVELIPNIGHDLKETRTAATCEAAGKLVSECQREGCDYSTESTLAQLGHDYKVTETKAADCTNKGYTLEVCQRCQKERKSNEQAPTGHSYIAENAQWVWQPDGSAAVLKVSCAYDSTHVKELKATITSEAKAATSCMSGGAVVYTANVAFNGQTYTDTLEIVSGAVGHTPGTEIKSDASGHYYLCSACGEKVNAAGHTWGEETVKLAAGCATEGQAAAACTVCGYEKTWALPATGNHTFVHDVCTQCGYDQKSCDHLMKYRTVLDLSGYGFCEGAEATVLSCSCGKNQEIMFSNCCTMEWVNDIPVTLPDGQEIIMEGERCTQCGMTIISRFETDISDDQCTGEEYVMSILLDGQEQIQYCRRIIGEVQHPVHLFKELVDLEALGLCGGSLEIVECSCGEYCDVSENTLCDWTYHYDEELQKGIRTCLRCGAYMTDSHEYVEDDNTCYEEIITTITLFDKDGNQLWSGESRRGWDAHYDLVSGYEMMGETCEDGVLITYRCQVCQRTITEVSYDHPLIVTTRTDLSDANICAEALVQRACPCGKGGRSFYMDGDCQHDYWIEDPKTGAWVATCEKCGAVERTTSSIGPKDANCRATENRYVTYTDKDGNYIITGYGTNIIFDHAFTFEFTLLGESCEDGVKVKQSCKDCGTTHTFTESYHVIYDPEIVDLTPYGVCATQMEVYQCPCGYDKWVQFDKDCEWEWIEGTNKSDTWQCRNCGMVSTCEIVDRWKEGCTVYFVEKYTYYIEGKLLAEYENTYTTEEHALEYAFHLLGQTCSDGYTFTATCADCGYVYEETEVLYSCDRTYTLEEKVLCETPCGEFTVRHDICACGENENWRAFQCCDYYSTQYDQELDGYVGTCVSCGAKIMNNGSYDTDEENCTEEVTRRLWVSYEGEVLAQWEKTFNRSYHSFVYDMTLKGEDCEDGYTYIATCAVCGRTDQGEGWGHETRMVYRADLKEYGLCGGEIWVNSCACGENCDWEYYRDCSITDADPDAETGLAGYYCPQCKMALYVGEVGQKDENCMLNGHLAVKLVQGEETLLNDRVAIRTELHDFEILDAILLDSTLGCEGGVEVTRQCADCGKTRTSEHYYHFAKDAEQLQLADYGACGGNIEIQECLCGEERWISKDIQCEDFVWKYWEETIDGVEHIFRQETCSVCGLVILRDETETQIDDSCYRDVTEICTLTLDGEEIFQYEDAWMRSYHDYEGVYTLMPGSQTCEDGLSAIFTCKLCGEVTDGWSKNHEGQLVESIDLAQYGAVCGATLEHYKCPCGECEYYEFSEDTACDIGWSPVELWPEDAMETNRGQDNTEGWIWLNDEAYICACAVTDPQCGLKMRYARYYVLEGCEAVEYEIWQLGYDDQTGTYQKELKTATGVRELWHSYTEKEVSGSEDGMNYSGTVMTCSVCGSEYSSISYMGAETGSTLKWVYTGTNTLDNGYTKYIKQSQEYGYTYKGYDLITLDRQETVDAEGVESWWEYAYTYDYTSGCYCTVNYSDSDGSTDTYKESAHLTQWNWEVVEEPTCSQHGLGREFETCVICGTVTWERFYDLSPTGHSFSYDEELETYVCDVCGMENANGISGSIILEDLTDSLGGNTDHVVGYCNDNELECTTYVSVALLDAAEGEEEELLLTGITLTWLTKEADDVVAVSFSRADALAAAEAAMEAAGYTGSYALRLTFVPTDDEGMLDYAITFDPEQ